MVVGTETSRHQGIAVITGVSDIALHASELCPDVAKLGGLQSRRHGFGESFDYCDVRSDDFYLYVIHLSRLWNNQSPNVTLETVERIASALNCRIQITVEPQK